MKLAVIVSLAGLLQILCATVNAGGVEVRLLNRDNFWSWQCGTPAPAEEAQAKPVGENAKFGEMSSCPTLVITNDSTETVKVQVQVTGPGFEQRHRGGFTYGMSRADGKNCEERIRDRSCESLAPGHGCDAEFNFSPEQSGTSRGRLEVLITGTGKPVSKIYELTAIGDYSPALKAIDAVIQRHRAELAQIPHVVRVSISDSDDNVIQIEVAHEEDIAKVERSVPPKLEGHRVKVVEQIQRVWGY